MPSANTAQSIALRCDGDSETGAGHVGRCLPIADSFRRRGWKTTFVGRYGGIARYLIDNADHRRVSPSPPDPCGVSERYGAAILDCYALEEKEIATLARTRPVATLGESPTCAGLAILVDFHVDRLGARETPHLLPGPRFAPVDPRFRSAATSRRSVERVLVTLGGGIAGEPVLSIVRTALASRFPGVEIVEPSATNGPTPLHALIDGIDLAVCSAGFTAYELGTAGIPSVLIQLVDNQQRVVSGMTNRHLALAVDARRENLAFQLERALGQLTSPVERSEVQRRLREVFDGDGAELVVEALISRGFGVG